MTEQELEFRVKELEGVTQRLAMAQASMSTTLVEIVEALNTIITALSR